MLHLYRLVMDPSVNALGALPKPVRLQIMLLLAILWSVVFSVYVGMFALIGPTIAAHALLIVATLFTADIFRRARKGTLDAVRLANLGVILTGHYIVMRAAALLGR